VWPRTEREEERAASREKRRGGGGVRERDRAFGLRPDFPRRPRIAPSRPLSGTWFDADHDAGIGEGEKGRERV
jgi:hypothetical protein